MRIPRNVRDRYSGLSSGFTLIELLVVVAIFGIITTAVVTNLKTGEYSSELRLAAHALVSQIRAVQTMAQTGRIVEMCRSEGAIGDPGYCRDSRAGQLCAGEIALCDCSCADQASPGGYGLHIDGSSVTAFADVNSSRLYEAGEELSAAEFELPARVAVQSVLPASPLDVVFTPPSGTVWIAGCDPEAPDSVCGASAQIVLSHTQTSQVRTVTIYRVTGRVDSR